MEWIKSLWIEVARPHGERTDAECNVEWHHHCLTRGNGGESKAAGPRANAERICTTRNVHHCLWRELPDLGVPDVGGSNGIRMV